MFLLSVHGLSVGFFNSDVRHISYYVCVLQAAGTFQGHNVYGIKGLVLRASRLQSIVEECAAAAKSNDARDKYFETHVSEFAPCSSKALRSELPSLEVGPVHSCQQCQQPALYHMCFVMCETKAARTSLASVVAELVGVLPKIGSCRKAVGFMSSGGWGNFETCFFCSYHVAFGLLSEVFLRCT